MVVMGIHVRHIRHRARPVVPMAFVFFSMLVTKMFVVMAVVLPTSRSPDQLGGH